jgi:hypothetical protein
MSCVFKDDLCGADLRERFVAASRIRERDAEVCFIPGPG